MKKLIVVVTIFVVITFFVMEHKLAKKEKDEVPVSLTMDDEKRALFISYIELEEYIKDKDNKTSKENIIKILDDMKNNQFNMAILHVRPFSDAIYESKIFPYSSYVSKEEGVAPGYDVLKYFIEEAHKRNIELHAWINPYRVRNTTSTSDISKDNPAFQYLNTNHVKVIEGKGIFYNPASKEVTNLIVSGIEELVINYDVDGIHFDDYFYPDDTIDLENYQEYLTGGGTLSLSDYRLNNTKEMIKQVYDKIKSIKPNVSFGISPEGNIHNNYDTNYIDTKKLLSEEGYLDYIMPQIYFGFENEVMPFIETVNMWNALIKVPTIKLIPALGVYKSGKEDGYAKSGSKEWVENNDIIKKQIVTIRTLNHYQGFSLFRYSYLFNEEYKTDSLVNEKENLLSVVMENEKTSSTK